jgi:hypothetical protein
MSIDFPGSGATGKYWPIDAGDASAIWEFDAEREPAVERAVGDANVRYEPAADNFDAKHRPAIGDAGTAARRPV